MQKRLRISQTLVKTETKIKTETEKPQRPLPLWCRGIMGGCVNCGGCA